MKLSELIPLGFVIQRDGEFDLLAKLTDSVSGRALSYLENAQFIDSAINNRCLSCLIVHPDFSARFTREKIGIIISDNPKYDFIRIHNYLARKHEWKTTTIGKDCCISPSAQIAQEGVTIGNNVIIGEYVIIYEGVSIGDNTIIKSNCVLGCSEYERCKDECGNYHSSLSIGRVWIGSNTEIDEYTSVAKAMFEWNTTSIGNHCFIARRVDISHGVIIGDQVIVGTGALFCGYSVVGDGARIGPEALVSNRVNIGCGAIVSLGSVVTKDVLPNQRVSGNFAFEHRKFIRFIKRIANDTLLPQ